MHKIENPLVQVSVVALAIFAASHKWVYICPLKDHHCSLKNQMYFHSIAVISVPQSSTSDVAGLCKGMNVLTDFCMNA